ncbi:MAG: Hpt domain-containing protein, partial [Campylobacteraceae bacterium]|nr:Hpt domain-containing protein [Campylobacteraceae bacterium]
MDDIQEILEDFLVEAFELIEQIDQDLVELENNPEDLELLNRIFRVAHTVKGSSSFLNFDVLTKLTHHMEDVLNKARKGELKITPEVMDVVLKSIDMMKELLVAIRDDGNDTNVGMDISEICTALDAISQGNDIPTQSTQASQEEIVEANEQEEQDGEEIDYNNLSDDEVEAEIERLLKQRKEEDKKRKADKKKASQEAQSTSVETKPSAKPNVPKQTVVKKPQVNVPAKKQAASTIEQTIRVEVKRLDHLMNLIGELVLGKNRLLKIYDDVEERYEGEKFLEELNQVVSSVSLVTTDLQIAVMKTR